MPRRPNPNLAAWIAEYEAGATLHEIATAHNRTQPGIWLALKRAGVAMRPKGSTPGVKKRSSHWHADAIAARERGEPFESIAARVFRSPSAVKIAVYRHRQRAADEARV
jgi:hypothetical protein